MAQKIRSDLTYLVSKEEKRHYWLNCKRAESPQQYYFLSFLLFSLRFFFLPLFFSFFPIIEAFLPSRWDFDEINFLYTALIKVNYRAVLLYLLAIISKAFNRLFTAVLFTVRNGPRCILRYLFQRIYKKKVSTLIKRLKDFLIFRKNKNKFLLYDYFFAHKTRRGIPF